jgi:DNA-binding transcriptional LysR family regulator
VPFVELSSQRCVLFQREQSPTMHDLISGCAISAGISLKVEESDDPNATAIMVNARPVVALCSAPRATQACAMPSGLGAVAVPLVDPVPRLGLNVAWRTAEDNPLVEAFLRAMDDAGPFTAPPPDPDSAAGLDVPLG